MASGPLRTILLYLAFSLLSGCDVCWWNADEIGCKIGGKWDTAGDGDDCADDCYAGDGSVPTASDGTEYTFMDQSWACERLDGDTPISRAFSVASHHVFPDYVTDNGTSITYGEIESAWETAVDGLLPSDGSGANVQIGTSFVTDTLDGDDSLINAVFMEEGFVDNDVPEGSLAKASCTQDSTRECLSIDCDIRVATEGRYAGVDTPLPFSTASSTAVGYVSLAYIFEHELGHTLGLGHQAAAGFPGTIMESTVYWDSSTAWDFFAASSDDQQALAWIYGG